MDLSQAQRGFPKRTPLEPGKLDSTTGIYVLHRILFVYDLAWVPDKGFAA